MIKKTFLPILLALLFVGVCSATEVEQNDSLEEISKSVVEDFQNKTVRVLISDAGVFEHKEVVLNSPDELFVTSGNNLVFATINPVTVSFDGNSFVVRTAGIIKRVSTTENLIFSTKNLPIEISTIKKKSQNARFLGKIEISTTVNNCLNVINILDIEDYIRGVIPNEMPITFGLEALKAQAIAARGYVYRDSKRKDFNYDVCDTVGSQVYNGYNSYSPISDEAVSSTMGQFALYDGDIILSLYSSTPGGHSENYENVFSQNGLTTKFPSEPIPYLRGVADWDTEKDLSVEESAKEFYTTKPRSYDEVSPRYRWEYFWDVAELENILIKNLMKFSSNEFVTPSLKKPADFGKLLNIDVPKRGVSGKAMYLRITTTKNTFLVAKEIMIRKILEYNKKWLPSANIILTRVFDGEKLVGVRVNGGGYGHGVGMSQYGASGMAKKGFSYDEILKHYYKGISIGSYPVECNLKEMKNCRTTFNSKDKNAYLFLEFEGKPYNLTFKVNDTTVVVSAENFSKKKGKVNIKKWMEKGTNIVELVDYQRGLFDFSQQASIKFYVEIGKNEK